MNLKSFALALLALALLGACGIPDDTKISELDADQRQQFCEDLSEYESQECEGDGTVSYQSFESVDECTTELEAFEGNDSCQTTVGDMETFASDPCSDDGQRAASTVFTCLGG